MHRLVRIMAAGALIAAVCSAPVHAGDTRIAVTLSASQRDHMLSGMRTYLSSIEDILTGLATYDREAVSSAARRSGAKMLVDIAPTVAIKLPLEFTSLSLITHDQFDKLAERAEQRASRSELLHDLSAIMTSCNGCHASFRLVTPR